MLESKSIKSEYIGDYLADTFFLRAKENIEKENDINSNTTCDLGTGGGMPGLIVAIAMKKIKNTYSASSTGCCLARKIQLTRIVSITT